MLNLLFPTCCAGCGVLERGRICPECAPVGLCALAPPDAALHACWRVDDLDGALGVALRRAKYRPDRGLMLVLAQHLARVARPIAGLDVVVVPVPTTPLRQLQRGFSPAAILAGALARDSHVAVASPLRLREGRRQASLGRRERLTNLTGRLDARQRVAGRVLLVDDVLTTGATAAACARELLCAGASQVDMLALVATRRPAWVNPDKVGQQFGLIRPYGEYVEPAA